MKIGPWMNEVDQERIHADADYGILVIKYKGVGERNVGKFLTCMRWDEADHLTRLSRLPSDRFWELRYGVKQAPVQLLKANDVMGREVGQMSMVVHKQRGTTSSSQDYHFMWLEDRLTLLQMAGYGEVRHLNQAIDMIEEDDDPDLWNRNEAWAGKERDERSGTN